MKASFWLKKALCAILCLSLILGCALIQAPKSAAATQVCLWLGIKVTNVADKQGNIQTSTITVTYTNAAGGQSDKAFDLKEMWNTARPNGPGLNTACSSIEWFKLEGIPGTPVKATFYHDANMMDEVKYHVYRFAVGTAEGTASGGPTNATITRAGEPIAKVESGGVGNSAYDNWWNINDPYDADTTTQAYVYGDKYNSVASSSTYSDYNANKNTNIEFAVPGITDGKNGGVRLTNGFFRDYVAQGMAYDAHMKKIFISAYSDSKQNSVIFVLSASGQYEKTLEINNYTGHAGGVACDGTRLFIVSGLNYYYVPLATVKTALAQSAATVKISMTKKAVTTNLCGVNVGSYTDSSNLFSSCSFCTWFNGLFWFGEFSLNEQSDSYPYRESGESYFFGVDVSNPASPVLKKVMTVPCKTQGATFFKDTAGNVYLAVSMSYSRKNDSTLRFYKLNQSEWGTDSGEGQGVMSSSGATRFVHKNSNIKSIKMPCLMEAVCTLPYSAKLYALTLYESSAYKYADSADTVMDRVSAVNVSSLLGITASTTMPTATHSYALTGEQAATCTAKGYEDYTCSVCTATKRENLAALGHSFGAWQETIPATCTEPGEETRICARDASHTETREMAVLGHDFSLKAENDNTLAADYSGEPEYYYSCRRCGAVDKQSANRFLHTTNTIYGAVETANLFAPLCAELLKDGEVLQTKQLPADSDGRVVFGDTGNGVFTVRLSGKHLLTTTITNVDFSDGSALKLKAAFAELSLSVGDVNADEVIDIADISALLAENVYGSDREQEDVNGDGVVSVEDIRILLLESNFAKTAKTIDYESL